MTPFHIHPQLYPYLNKTKIKDAPILGNGNIVRVMHAMLDARSVTMQPNPGTGDQAASKQYIRLFKVENGRGKTARGYQVLVQQPEDDNACDRYYYM
ncbi:hypothetical protein GE21DRAFT_9646 [Neurospora crassa]|uniref:Uncharacterized protein n=1 Tax=Neurospora crassa (strain ATCC 24698 / 74-OR23-1A / CBS 708.71 / DSM 1257 / FGSC 987) TaxID=367110 RepID=Q7S0R0_NEUCR|nr:hypothetical protein NCU09289 [Neurospora crassa OR74A]EAA28905.3 hypothetical protein NCU09289 [Neurospora crassa OR74A]KHE80389.1 hypothetical protein GE21DRAFT_9646 [Neurospora crassa]|eukprot:XP_958141.3 hypothetical protein NCU09289 [Neurospora crassa OR74A]